ncbi:DNA glycosylase [Aaosphaeria arxii CBS 175.79]|uniref:DNA glycosylase n=1 Tax=Aaosphaeria arxii CBS 175.79 TaxID=1450172 RepID=A0A6A5Y281_9PLEO|nr:DNA glycosylase [Aaosphaeria arxii CBS 175.79]KAF2019147.1 DNA glycosylase [Aaosphaeria arxii CBS 175.79]
MRTRSESRKEAPQPTSRVKRQKKDTVMKASKAPRKSKAAPATAASRVGAVNNKKKDSQRQDHGALTLAIHESQMLAGVLGQLSSAFHPLNSIVEKPEPSLVLAPPGLPALGPYGNATGRVPSIEDAIASLQLASHGIVSSAHALTTAVQPFGGDPSTIAKAPSTAAAPQRKRKQSQTTSKKASLPDKSQPAAPTTQRAPPPPPKSKAAPSTPKPKPATKKAASSSAKPKKTSTVSEHFEPFSMEITPPGLNFTLSPSRFGLIQERICSSLWALVVQAILWNQTTAKAARPVLFKLLTSYPTPESMAAATVEDVCAIIGTLGLQNRRSEVLIKLAQAWLQAPPDASRRYAVKNYPKTGENLELADGELLGESDLRRGFEISHLPGVGPYAIDSYRIFYRDTLRGIETSGDEVVEPEWKRVVPADKDLRAYLEWRWREEGWNWNKVTGEKKKIIEPVRRSSRRSIATMSSTS